MKKYLISILLLSMSFADLLSPENGVTLHTTHVKFEWEQVPDAINYTVTIYDESTGEYINENVESLIYINNTFFNWNTSYSWYVTPIFEDGSQGSMQDSDGNTYLSFSISDSRSNVSVTGSYTGNEITIFSSFLDYYSAAIDKDGNEIWNSQNENLIFYNTDYYGQLFGAQYDYTLQNNLPAIEFNIDNTIIFQEPNEHFAHHEMIQLPNGNYMSIVEDIRLGPIPTNLPDNLSLLFQFLGYTVDGFTSEFPWVGDRIVEWDADGNEVWSWNTFDYYSQLDYDYIAGTWAAAFNDGRFDWTHANAFWFSEQENAIYFSVRHLSRITKIDYTTGDVIWNMGLAMPSGDVDCGQELGFSFQHSIMQLDNGNLITFDNGNLSTTLNDTDYPTSRGLEIQVDESDNSCDATIVWDYDLPESLFGFASGNIQKLNNGNYLITTVGDGGTSIEVNPDNNEIIWEANYNLSFPNGAVYRANRLPGLHPVAFSVIVENMYIGENGNITVDNTCAIQLHNNGSRDETFYIPLIDENIHLEPNQIAYLNMPIAINTNVVEIEIIPIHRQDLSKEITVYIGESSNQIQGCMDIEACNYNPQATEEDNSCTYINIGECDCDGNILDCSGECGGNAALDECGECEGSGPEFECNDGTFVCNENDCSSTGQCEDNFTYFELNDLPSSTIVLDQSQCFSNIDLSVLQDIITINSLDINPIEIGTQNWFNGHLTRLTIGNFYDGGNVTLTNLPESIGDLPNIAILYFNYNELTSLPDSITNLTNLIYLVLSFNQLTHLPENIGNLSNMIWLDLGYNSLESIPESIGEFSLINYLWIFNNNLSELPESICNLDLNWNGLDYNFLPYFGSGGNMLCGELPSCVANSENINTSIDPLYYSFLITVEQDCECGGQMDVNMDGVINVIDIISLVNTILSGEEITDEQLCSHDVNADGILNVIDIVALVNTILGTGI